MNIDLTKIDNVTEMILKGKFSKTIAKIEAVYKEAKGDEEIGTTYGAVAVRSRIEKLREIFYKELNI